MTASWADVQLNRDVPHQQTLDLRGKLWRIGKVNRAKLGSVRDAVSNNVPHVPVDAPRIAHRGNRGAVGGSQTCGLPRYVGLTLVLDSYSVGREWVRERAVLE